MSIETWEAEFYPVPADEVSKEDALDHSIRKWEGALPENLTRHDVRFEDRAVIDSTGNLLSFSAWTCSLCVAFTDEDDEVDECRPCPVWQETGRDCIPEYRESSVGPLPMLNLLKRVKAKQEEGK